jgi:serine/threonine-protein phosphatase 5
LSPRSTQGNDLSTAIQLYSDSIEKNPNEPTVWCNRAYARMKPEEFGHALNDASEVCSPSFIPAFVESAS